MHLMEPFWHFVPIVKEQGNAGGFTPKNNVVKSGVKFCF